MFAGNGLDGFLVSSVLNVTYLTGFTGESTPLIVLRDRVVAVSDFRYLAQIETECPGLEAHIRPVGQKLWSAVAEVVGTLGIARLGFESNGMLVSDHEAIRSALPSVAMTGLSGRVERLRAIKDDEEVAAIRRSVAVAERAFAMLRAGLRLDETELDATEHLEGSLRRCGASAAAFDPIVASGPRSARPHARPSAEGRLDEAEFLLVDWGASVAGYKSDLTRVLLTGNVGTTFETVYRAVLSAQERAIAAIHPGVRARDVDAVARSAIEAAGFGGSFGHGLGHGIGLAIHESPWLRPDSDDILEAGMVLAVEPGIYLPGWGGIRIEDDVLVTSDGADVLTGVAKARDTLRPY